MPRFTLEVKQMSMMLTKGPKSYDVFYILIFQTKQQTPYNKGQTIILRTISF
ncbi:predicted protein [Botrytis cinerea T4]|uniref:Uncharacterized protein n=1 Tax=Botryotinia fuckeliana (strain T4) TaxID=999810 RepID=G2Y5B6_BOTF4|nr:predicted protein [Botrytis cinerea T4]